MLTATAGVTVRAHPIARSISGKLSTGQRGLGRRQVRGRRRGPAPDARTTSAKSPTCGTLGAMEQRRWVNQTQPQTLQIAVLLLYFNGIINLIFGGLSIPIWGPVIIIGSVAAGYGIANERKWGYILGVAMAFLPFVLTIAYRGSFLSGGVINLLFEVALVALLLHPQSRDYQRIWFK